jgi:hypothetical protein
MTQTTKERLLLKAILTPTQDCATPAQLERMEPEAGVAAHLAACPRCQAERALLTEFNAAAPLPDEARQVSWISQRLDRRFGSPEESTPSGGLMEPWWRRWFNFRSFNTAGLVFATAMLAIALGVGLRQGQKPGLSAPHGGDAAVLRSGELDTLSPMGDLEIAPDALRWQPLAGASSYSVQVMEVDRSQVWASETNSASAALPPQVLAQVVPGKPLLWQVTAKNASGTILAQSAVQRFRLKR